MIEAYLVLPVHRGCQAWMDFQGKKDSQVYRDPRESLPEMASRVTADWMVSRVSLGPQEREAPLGCQDLVGQVSQEIRAFPGIQELREPLGDQV